MAKLKEYNGRYCESEFESAFISFLEDEGWNYLPGNRIVRVLLSSKIGPVLANNFPPQLLKNLFSVSEAPALIIKVQYLALMRQPVQQSCCEDSVAKKLRPAIKAFI